MRTKTPKQEKPKEVETKEEEKEDQRLHEEAPKKIDSLQIRVILRRCTVVRRHLYLYDPLNVFFLTFRSIRPGVFRFFAIAFLISENELSKVGAIARFFRLPKSLSKFLKDLLGECLKNR